MELGVGVCDAVAVVDVCDEGGNSENVPTEMVFGKFWSAFCECEDFQVSYEC